MQVQLSVRPMLRAQVSAAAIADTQRPVSFVQVCITEREYNNHCFFLCICLSKLKSYWKCYLLAAVNQEM